MHLTRSVEIATPPTVVWEVMSDVTRWHEWTDSIKGIEWVEGNSITVGSVARIQQPMQSPALWTITAVEPGRSFTWQTSNKGSTFVGRHLVEPTANGSRATLVLDASGLGTTLMWPMLRLAIPRALKMEAEGLKSRAEERAPTAS